MWCNAARGHIQPRKDPQCDMTQWPCAHPSGRLASIKYCVAARHAWEGQGALIAQQLIPFRSSLWLARRVMRAQLPPCELHDDPRQLHQQIIADHSFAKMDFKRLVAIWVPSSSAPRRSRGEGGMASAPPPRPLPPNASPYMPQGAARNVSPLIVRIANLIIREYIL